MTYNERLAAAGIETVRSGHNDAFGNIVYLRYNGKQIRRPSASQVVEVVRREFGIMV